MKLSRIYASKIYLTSSRQDRIHAAINDPLNVELVQQVAEYLDEDSQQELKDAIAEKKARKAAASPDNHSSEESNENVFDDVDSHSGPASREGSAPIPHSSGSGNVFDDFDPAMPEGDAPEGDNSDTPEPPADTPSTDSEPVEESIEITGVNDIDSEDGPVLQSGVIKKLLNETDDASGVVRIDISDDEAWIYYDDKVNLNDVLDNVISIIKSNGYDMLKFSRLARTDNAVVFDIKE